MLPIKEQAAVVELKLGQEIKVVEWEVPEVLGGEGGGC